MIARRVVSAVFIVAMVGVSAGSVPLAMAQTEKSAGQSQVVVTVKAGVHAAPLLKQNDIAVKLDNRPADIVRWKLVTGSDPGMQLIFLFDSKSRSYLDRRIPSLAKFVEALPPSAAVGVAYMENGKSVMVGPLTTDHALTAKSLYAIVPNPTGSPYFCLSDLAKHWPSQQPASSRVIVMLSDGSDPYNSPGVIDDPFVYSAIQDAQKAGLIVYSVYLPEHDAEPLGGELHMQGVARQTGGQFYALIDESPAVFNDFVALLYQSLSRQYLLTLATPKPGWQKVSVQSKLSSIKLASPAAVYVDGKR